MNLYYVSPNFFQRFVWIPLRLFMINFCSLRIKGVKNVKNIDGNMIFASNHLSEMDPLLIVSCLPFFRGILPLIYVARQKKHYKVVWWKQILYGGTFFRIIGAYPSYKGMNNYEQALSHHIDVIKRGHNVAIFPNGKIVKGKKEVVKAGGGIAYLSITSGLPIIPIKIKGTQDLKFKDFYSGKRQISFTFGKPLYAKDIFRDQNKIIVNSKRNDYFDAAAKVMELVEKLK